MVELGGLGQQMVELPRSTRANFGDRARALRTWRLALAQGRLPGAGEGEEEPFPEEPFRSEFVRAMKDLEMPRFFRRHPKLVDTLLKNMLDLVYSFEEGLLQAERDAPPEPSTPPDAPQALQSGAPDAPAGDAGGQGDPEEDGEGEPEGPQEGGDREEDGEGEGEAEAPGAAESVKELAETLVNDLREQWQPAVEAMDAMDQLLGDNDMDSGSDGFSHTSSFWKNSGWKELKDLSKRLEDLHELRELVRSLGRGSGRGPMKEAPAEIESPGDPVGLVKSNLVPEETSGLFLSDSLSRMLPSEALLLTSRSDAVRMLWHAKRAERRLMSYEMVGWQDEESRLLDEMEIRPSGELGPIIVCLDTSGSMMGTRETIAKAVTLECLRGATLQKRKCYLYAFSGPEQCEELELGTSTARMRPLLDFLAFSFDGGTDVDTPLEKSLEKMREADWSRADILMVTDGEIPNAKPTLKEDLDKAIEEQGLRLHALLVGNRTSKAIEQLCTDIHLFKDWKQAEKRVRIS